MALTLALSAGLCSCTVEKPDLDAVSEQTESPAVSSSIEIEKDKLIRKGAHIKGDLSEKFHVDANIPKETENLPAYNLSKINLTEDQLAERLISGLEYSRKECDGGVIVYSNENEKLAVDLSGKYSDNYFSPSPSLTYALDKGKEFEYVFNSYIPYDENGNETSTEAVAQVKEILDKLPVKYDDVFMVERFDCERLNTVYSYRSSDEILELYGSPENMLSRNILLQTEGKGAELDNDFKFKEDDGCFLVKGNIMVNDISLGDIDYANYSITAAVSSRGVEYLKIKDLYLPDNGSTVSPNISPEQAAEVIYKDYEKSPNKEDYEVNINDIRLTYTKAYEIFDNGMPDVSKAALRPVWVLTTGVKDREGVYNAYDSIVFADTGDISQCFYWGDPAVFDDTESSESEKE